MMGTKAAVDNCLIGAIIGENHGLRFDHHTELLRIREAGLYRKLRLVESDQGPTLRLDGREVINFSSNNYLGLANHPSLCKAAKEAIDRYGCGSGASRLISGNMTLHEELESKIAELKGTEAALVFNSGFQANTGILSTLVGEGDVIFSDALNHASIIDGCRLSRAKSRCLWPLRFGSA